jgi:hypothetical protein
MTEGNYEIDLWVSQQGVYGPFDIGTLPVTMNCHLVRKTNVKFPCSNPENFFLNHTSYVRQATFWAVLNNANANNGWLGSGQGIRDPHCNCKQKRRYESNQPVLHPAIHQPTPLASFNTP